jgi:hypothetical protein
MNEDDDLPQTERNPVSLLLDKVNINKLLRSQGKCGKNLRITKFSIANYCLDDLSF